MHLPGAAEVFPHRSVPESRLPPDSSGLVHGQPAVWQHQSVFLVLHLLGSALHRQNRKDISIRIWTVQVRLYRHSVHKLQTGEV